MVVLENVNGSLARYRCYADKDRLRRLVGQADLHLNASYG
jgi:hypothetical protein